jgi:hypothetical protein
LVRVIADALDAAAVKAAVERICWRRGTRENDPFLVGIAKVI